MRLLHGETDSLRIEEPGNHKEDFVVSKGTCREAHQVKLGHHEGKWRLAVLRGAGLISYIGEFLADDNNRLVFTSGSEARELLELVQAANYAESMEEFTGSFVGGTKRKERFGHLVANWNCDPQSAVDRLRRIEVRTIDERELQEKVRWAAQALFVADPESVLTKLRTIAEDSVHRTITRDYLSKSSTGVAIGRRGTHSRWHLRPDEQVAIDWDTIAQCLSSRGTWRAGRNLATLSAETVEEARGIRHFVPSVLTFREVDSAATPLCQLADLLAGMAAYTRTNADLVRRQIAEGVLTYDGHRYRAEGHVRR